MADVEHSFIITFHKEEQFLIFCLNALLPNIPKNAEVIIIGVDLDSSVLHSHLRDNRIRLIELVEAIPFPEAVNKASQRAKGKVLILLDQDVIPFNNWFQKMSSFQRRISKSGRMCIVSSKLLDTQTGRIIDFGIGFTKYNAPHPWRGRKPGFELCRSPYKTQAACSAALMIDKKLFDLLGGLDRDLPHSYSDIDLCLRAKEHGFDTWVVADAMAYHYNGIPKSNQGHYKGDTKALFSAKNHQRTELDMEKYFLLNWNLFKAKNAIQNSYFLIDMTTVIDRDWHLNLITQAFSLKILDQITLPFHKRDDHQIDLYSSISWSTLRKKLPLVFLVDTMLSLKGNDLWINSRNCQNDVIMDRNGNITLFNDI